MISTPNPANIGGLMWVQAPNENYELVVQGDVGPNLGGVGQRNTGATLDVGNALAVQLGYPTGYPPETGCRIQQYNGQ
jgi:hypothetical protein